MIKCQNCGRLLPETPNVCQCWQHEGPLFLPLRAEFFDAFARGEKRTEYRLRGPRWNADTCRVGRRVILSRGYGRQHRLTGTVAGFHYDTLPAKLPGWLECYGPNSGDAACITITLDKPNSKARRPEGSGAAPGSPA